MSIELLCKKIREDSKELLFNDVIASIDEYYRYQPTKFSNGLGQDVVVNEAGSNQGSCKVFGFAQLNQLNEQETLRCFCEHYRDVLNDPQGDGHANIRHFMRNGWDGIVFDQFPLREK